MMRISLILLLLMASSHGQVSPEPPPSLEQTCLEILQNLPEEGFVLRAVPWRHELAPGQVLLYEMQAFLDNSYVLCLVAGGTPPFMVFTDESGAPVPVDFTTEGNSLLVRFTAPITGAILIRIKNDETQPLPVAFLYAFK